MRNASLLILVGAGALLPFSPVHAQDGRALVESLGCGACHGGVPGPDAVRAVAPPLGPGGASLPPAFTFDYLGDPTARREGIAPARMPDLRLSEEERVALALYLGEVGESAAEAPTGGDGFEAARSRHGAVTAAQGQLLFAALGCAGCHAEGAPVGPDLSSVGRRLEPDWVSAFLASPQQVRPAGFHPGTASRMPDFRLSADEVRAVSAYLSSLTGPAQRLPGASESRTLSGPEVERSQEPTAWARHRAERYLTDRFSCLGCHGWRGEGGRLAPPLDGVAQRLTPAGIRAMVYNPQGTHPGTLMPRSPFREDLLEEVVQLLSLETGGWEGAQAPELTLEERERFWIAADLGDDGGAGAAAGRTAYDRNCAACHGLDGGGAGFNAPFLPVAPTPHSDAALMSARPDDTLFDGVWGGGWVLDRSHRMPAFGQSLPRDTVGALVDYIRTLCACQGPSWSVTGGGS